MANHAMFSMWKEIDFGIRLQVTIMTFVLANSPDNRRSVGFILFCAGRVDLAFCFLLFVVFILHNSTFTITRLPIGRSRGSFVLCKSGSVFLEIAIYIAPMNWKGRDL